MFSSLPSLQGLADKGLVRVLAATSASTSPATKALPLVSATLPGFDYTTWYALYAPQATPAAVVKLINTAVRKALADPALEAKLEPHGVELLGSAPEEVAVWVQRDTEKWGRIVREAGITID
jgi:tripartite-type tricarboxylate transporter receptor subunit TctC